MRRFQTLVSHHLSTFDCSAFQRNTTPLASHESASCTGLAPGWDAAGASGLAANLDNSSFGLDVDCPAEHRSLSTASFNQFASTKIGQMPATEGSVVQLTHTDLSAFARMQQMQAQQFMQMQQMQMQQLLQFMQSKQ